MQLGSYSDRNPKAIQRRLRPMLIAHILLFPLERCLLLLLQVYSKWISPLFGPHCRFYPSCSRYSINAIKQHHLLLGLVLTVLRVSKCHPWREGGYDPVPEKLEGKIFSRTKHRTQELKALESAPPLASPEAQERN